MGKKTGVFVAGQHVFAKVKGYSPWPAKITRVIAKHRYAVYFYGTGETASVKSEDLDAYDERNRGRFNTDRQLKKGDYKEAVDQIEAAINGNDPAPIPSDDKNDTKNNNDLEFSTDATDNDNSADESQLQIAEDVLKSTPQPQKKKTVLKIKTEIVTPVTPEPEAKENDESKVSRSGRKIKEKKMNLDEMDPDEMFAQPRKRFKADDGKQKPVINQADSTSAIDDFRASKMHILGDPVKKGLLENQYEMIHVMQDIKLALGLEQADVDRSIELLEAFKVKNLSHITELMLLKYPNTVETVKRLRKYIGNLNSWGMEESQVSQFHEKAEKIRTTAVVIYDKFKALFNFPEDSSFWNKFAEQQKLFNEKYNALDPADLFEGLTYEELDVIVNSRTASTPEISPPPAIYEALPKENEEPEPTAVIDAAQDTSQLEPEPETQEEKPSL